jgi:hypothetical protein
MKIITKIFVHGVVCATFFLAGAFWQKHVEANKPFGERKLANTIKRKEKKKGDPMDPSNLK